MSALWKALKLWICLILSVSHIKYTYSTFTLLPDISRPSSTEAVKEIFSFNYSVFDQWLEFSDIIDEIPDCFMGPRD